MDAQFACTDDDATFDMSADRHTLAVRDHAVEMDMDCPVFFRDVAGERDDLEIACVGVVFVRGDLRAVDAEFNFGSRADAGDGRRVDIRLTGKVA